MDATECGAYWNLCVAHYQCGETGLPNDEKELAKLARCSLKVWRRISPKILLKFSQNETSTVHHKCVDVLRKVKEMSAQNSEKALKRHNKVMPGHKSGNAVAMQSINHKPESINHKPIIEVVSTPAAKAAEPPPSKIEFIDSENYKKIPAKVLVKVHPKFELPEEWGEDMEALGWSYQEIVQQSEKFRQYWVSGKGAGTRRSAKGWRQSWSTWMNKAAQWKVK